MGTILIEAWLEAKILNPADSNHYKSHTFQSIGAERETSGIKVAESAAEIVQQADFIFLCVKPLQINSLLQGIKHAYKKGSAGYFHHKPAFSLPARIGSECTLCPFYPEYNEPCGFRGIVTEFQQEAAVRRKCQLYMIWPPPYRHRSSYENDITRVASDIVSCGPAFFSYLAQAFIDAACQTTKIDKENGYDFD